VKNRLAAHEQVKDYLEQDFAILEFDDGRKYFAELTDRNFKVKRVSPSADYGLSSTLRSLFSTVA
jgi:hypothetical protein